MVTWSNFSVGALHMTTFPNSPKHDKGALLLMDPSTGNLTGVITLQINPAQLTRSLKMQGAGGEGGDRTEALRLTGPPVETIQLEVELDATDKLEFPKNDENQDALKFGLRPELAALESIVYRNRIMRNGLGPWLRPL
jgi:hypothetical protein